PKTPWTAPAASTSATRLPDQHPSTNFRGAALVLGGQAASAPSRLEQAAFVLAAFAASASWQLLLAGGGALLGRALTGARGQLVTALASSLLITVLAFRLLTSST
ncbi:lysine transporter LysE, partial [Streptomyces sp. NPDC005463]